MTDPGGRRGVRTIFNPGRLFGRPGRKVREPDTKRRYRGWCNCGWEGPPRLRAYKAEQDVHEHDHIEEAAQAEEGTC